MNTNGLAKMYDLLTPLERFRLSLAAAARGDTSECERLIHSAPKVVFEFVDDWPFVAAFGQLALLHLLELMDSVANHFVYLACAKDQKTMRTVQLVGCVFRAQLAGWRKFCSELGVDPHLFWRDMPGFGHVIKLETITNAAASSYELPLFMGSDGEHIVSDAEGRQDAVRYTADTVAAKLRADWRIFVDLWGGQAEA